MQELLHNIPPLDSSAVWAFLGGTLLSFFKSQVLSALRYILFCQFVDTLKQTGIRIWKAAKKYVPDAFRTLWEKFVGFETFLVDVFSHWSQSQHWSFFWIVYAIAWTVFRQYWHPAWYNDQLDMLVLTWAFSIFPFFTENAMKRSQALQLEKHADSMRLLEDQQELLLGLSELNIELGEKILGVLAQAEEKEVSNVIE